MSYRHADLLPSASTPFERSLAEANDPLRRLMDIFGSIPAMDEVPAPRMLPFLVWERGLGELSPYLPTLYRLLDEGKRWQWVRGTPAAIYRALGWLGYAGLLEEEPTRHRRWNRFQIGLDRVRVVEDPDLGRIEGVVSLSPPARSHFTRSYHGYDVRAAETSYQRLSGSIVGDHSGVRFAGGAVQWSFGRDYEITHVLTEAELTALGTWIPPVPSDLWVDLNVPWTSLTYLWADPAAQSRRDAIAAVVGSQPVHVAFRDAAGATIGWRRATVRPISVAADGEYLFAGARWTAADPPTELLAFCRTGFGDGAGAAAASVALVIGAQFPQHPPGRLWIPGTATIAGGVEIASSALTIPFGETVREHVQFQLGLDGPY